jgi:hypothetical protein
VNCEEKPLFVQVAQQGQFLKYYRDKKFIDDFTLNNYVVALFNTKGKQVAVYQELAQNDFMSTLAITTGTIKAGDYVLVV